MATPLVEVFGKVLDWPRVIRASLRSLLADIEAIEAGGTVAAHLADTTPHDATATPTASKIPIAAGDGTLTAWIGQMTESAAGIAEVGTQAEHITGTDDSRVTTPKKLAEFPAWWSAIQRPGRQFNWTRPGVTAITATPKLDADGGAGIGAWVPCQATDGTTKIVRVTSALTCTITTAGAAGLHSGYSEAASTGYDLFLIWGSSPGANLIMVPHLTADGWALPATYTHVSRALFHAYNSSGSDLFSFKHTGDLVLYEYGSSSGTVLSGGTATSITSFSCSGLAPSWATSYFRLYGINAQATVRTITVSNSAGNGALVTTQAGSTANNHADHPFLGTPDSSDNLYYLWSGSVTTGATIRISGYFL